MDAVCKIINTSSGHHLPQLWETAGRPRQHRLLAGLPWHIFPGPDERESPRKTEAATEQQCTYMAAEHIYEHTQVHTVLKREPCCNQLQHLRVMTMVVPAGDAACIWSSNIASRKMTLIILPCAPDVSKLRASASFPAARSSAARSGKDGISASAQACRTTSRASSRCGTLPPRIIFADQAGRDLMISRCVL